MFPFSHRKVTSPLYTLSTEAACAWSAEGSLKHLLPNGKLLLLSLAKCHDVACALPSRITTKVLKNCKTFSSRPRPRPKPNVQDQDQDQVFMIQDQDFHFCPRGASRPRPWSRGLQHWLFSQCRFFDYDMPPLCPGIGGGGTTQIWWAR